MGRSRRKLIWAQSTGLASFTANGQYYTTDLLQNYKTIAGASTSGITIMRTHLTVVWQAPVAADSFYVGLRVDDVNQVTAAPAALLATNPNPQSNPYVDWMYSDHLIADATGVFGRAPSQFQGLVLDSRSKRRMEEVQEAYLLTIVQDSVTTVAKNMQWFARTLIALP